MRYLTRREVTKATHRNAFELWTAAEDRLLLRLAAPKQDRWGKHRPPNWIAIANRLDRTILAVQNRVSVLRAACRIAAGLKEKTP
jgi:hypothetical protein